MLKTPSAICDQGHVEHEAVVVEHKATTTSASLSPSLSSCKVWPDAFKVFAFWKAQLNLPQRPKLLVTSLMCWFFTVSRCILVCSYFILCFSRFLAEFLPLGIQSDVRALTGVCWCHTTFFFKLLEVLRNWKSVISFLHTDERDSYRPSFLLHFSSVCFAYANRNMHS